MTEEENTIRQIVCSVSPVSDQSLNEIIALVRYKTIPRDEIFIRPGQANDSEYFILEGHCRSFLMNTEGEEITISFFPEKSVLSPHLTRTNNGSSILNFQALTNLKIGFFSAGLFLELMIRNMEVRNFANEVLKQELLLKVEKETGMASLTAKERLIQFRKKFRGLENIVPHPQIASYLGITNISLSRIRGELAKEN